MTKNDKIKLGAAAGVFVIAAVLIAWQFSNSGDRMTKLDPEMAGPVIEPPKDSKGQPITDFGNRAVPAR